MLLTNNLYSTVAAQSMTTRRWDIRVSYSHENKLCVDRNINAGSHVDVIYYILIKY